MFISQIPVGQMLSDENPRNLQMIVVTMDNGDSVDCLKIQMWIKIRLALKLNPNRIAKFTSYPKNNILNSSMSFQMIQHIFT